MLADWEEGTLPFPVWAEEVEPKVAAATAAHSVSVVTSPHMPSVCAL